MVVTVAVAIVNMCDKWSMRVLKNAKNAKNALSHFSRKIAF